MTLKDINEIKKSLDSNKVIIGTNNTIRNIKIGKVLKVYLSNNCQKNIQRDIESYSEIADIKCTTLNKSKEDMGVICKKPFSISVLGILNEKQ